MTRIAFVLAFFFSTASWCQADETINYPSLRYETYTYRNYIKTTQLYPSGNPMGFPAVSLNGGRLELHFDDLDADHKNYTYTLIHCNADWTPTAITKNEYLEGYQEYFIPDYDFSFNTFVPYTHYTLSIPNANMRPTKSGNYLLVVAENNDWEFPIITRRFMVYEDLVQGSIDVVRPVMLEKRESHQEIDLILNHKGYEIPNPFSDLKVVLMQNQRWDNAITNLVPQFVREYQLVYNYERENLFEGGNEFRWFDTKNLMVLGQNVRKVERDSVFTAYLLSEKSRAIQRYTTWEDINGQRVVRRQNSDLPDYEADYAWVDFFIEYPWPLENGNIYVFGALSDWQPDAEFRMNYRYDLKGYTAKILIKQGFYNYVYALQTTPNSPLSLEPMEGSHWETENSYQLLIYHREIGLRYDRLVGYNQGSSDQLY